MYYLLVPKLIKLMFSFIFIKHNYLLYMKKKKILNYVPDIKKEYFLKAFTLYCF